MSTESTHIEDKDKFALWFTGFIDGHRGLCPSDLSGWFDNVQKNHQDIRNFIGGVRLIKDIKLKEEQTRLYPEEYEKFSQELFGNVPFWKSMRQLSSDILASPKCEDQHERTVKTAKFVRSTIENYLLSLNLRKTDHDEILKRTDVLLSKLGERWALMKTGGSSVNVRMTTSANAFALLGHHVCDSKSCFRQGKENDRHKYILGQSKDTFVVLLNRNDVRIARFWGFANANKTAISVCNGYYTKGSQQGDTLGALHGFFADLWKDKSVRMIENNISIRKGVYHNVGRPDWTFYVTPSITIQTPQWTFGSISPHYICVQCNTEHDMSTRHLVDGTKDVCEDCFSRLPICNRCLTPTMKTMQDYSYLRRSRGEYKVSCEKVCENCIVNERMLLCSMCNCFALPTNHDDGPFMCSCCAHTRAMNLRRMFPELKGLDNTNKIKKYATIRNGNWVIVDGPMTEAQIASVVDLDGINEIIAQYTAVR